MFTQRLLPLALVATGLAPFAHAAELRVLTHDSFELPKPLLAQFEKQAGVKLSIIKAGDAGAMVNKLILTRANPIADVAYGIDNSLVGKAAAAGVIEPYAPADKALQSLPDGVVSIDYGYVTLNIDKAWFAKHGKPLPSSLDALTTPAYKDLLVVPNPATSSPGLAFLSANVQSMGEDKAFAFWARLRDNGVKVAKGWSEAYYTDFSRNGGSRPIVVSYATSPAAEVFYSKQKLTESPTANLNLPGGVFQQVEGAALIKGGGEREAARKFIDFMRSTPVQQALQTTMWMYPVNPAAAIDPVFKHADKPGAVPAADSKAIAARGQQWVARWTRVVLKGGQ
ncbi:thiamine ABC transporter substrate-binding protein [Crenobacter sp. SG2305]|uniref:thiamine ABC transporter substrate-binding protein n=1 Tax=Crenobacter oryzisoli TaxID=3056844 RepID=UPI0025AAA84C|nr:thiamine ABC transporter substrate-binding protein [Crenobacter sp. SG2305]MDN0084059.1 thiamine ABC transporter substrate-binding protein [Crenobacter sp. SG2305]